MKPAPILLIAAILAVAGCADRHHGPTSPDDAHPAAPASVATPQMASHSCELPVSLADAYAELDALQAHVAALEASGALNRGQARALRNHIDNARRHLDAGHVCPALAQIRALREQVGNFVDAGVLTGPEAAPLLEGADRVLGDTPPSPALAFQAISAGNTHTCGITLTGEAYCWGTNEFGQLGDGSMTDRRVPAAVAGGLTFTAITAGWFHTCGLIAGGAAYCWGLNESGLLGAGSAGTHSTTPLAVSGGHDFDMLSAGTSTTCGIASGAAWCWGNNLLGSVGDGTHTDRGEPTAVLGGAFTSVDVGYHFACALRADGTAWCWGFNAGGALGNASIDLLSNEPVAVSGDLAFSSISSGNQHSCALALDGTPYCWGRNQRGQVGDGTNTSRDEPTPVSGGRTFDRIVAGDRLSCALTAEEIAWCWGDNERGGLGDGTFDDSSVPVAVVTDLRFQTITAADQACGTSASAAYCWGYNGDGRLGDGTTVNRTSPTPVSGPGG